MANPMYGQNKDDNSVDALIAVETEVVNLAAVETELVAIAAGGDAVDDAAAATATAADVDNTEILADVDDIRAQLNALIASLEGTGVLSSV